jgi:RsiW-degrading membrane proteinase PrsW (M82 family)
MGLGESEGRLDELAMPRRTFMREINFLRWSTYTGTGLDALGARSKNSFVLLFGCCYALLLLYYYHKKCHHKFVVVVVVSILSSGLFYLLHC